MTTNTNYFLQNGFYFDGTTGSVIWTTDRVGNYPQIIQGIPYVASHQYWFAIAGSPYNWQMCQYDTLDLEAYECIQEQEATGDNLMYGPNTSIWFENFNPYTNWADNFGALQIDVAEIYINGVNQTWASTKEHLHTIHYCGLPPLYPTTYAIAGSLINGGRDISFLIIFPCIVNYPPTCRRYYKRRRAFPS